MARKRQNRKLQTGWEDWQDSEDKNLKGIVPGGAGRIRAEKFPKAVAVILTILAILQSCLELQLQLRLRLRFSLQLSPSAPTHPKKKSC